jgi:RNA polymerase sigma-70 factor (ECF subfamily)
MTAMTAVLSTSGDYLNKPLGQQAQCADWLRSRKQEDLAAFNQLVLEHQDSAYNLAYYLLGDPDLAEDVTQKAFLNAYLKFCTFQGDSFRAWILTIVRNACYDELRLSKRRRVLSIDDLEEEDAGDSIWLEASRQVPTPEQAFDSRETQDLIEKALATLREEYREVLVLVDLQGLEYQAAAQVIGRPVGTVKSRLARARRQLMEAPALMSL